MRFDEPENYQYLTPRVVRGWTLPDVDGTGAERVSHFEAAQYLVEMARERYHWTIGPSADLSLIAPAYETTGFPLTHELLSQLANAVHSGGTIGDFAYSSDYALIAADADMQNVLDYVKYGNGAAVDLWRAGKGVVRVSPSRNAVPRVEELDTYRRLYRDLSNMKRYVFHNECTRGCTEAKFKYDRANVVIGDTHLFGPVQISASVANYGVSGHWWYEDDGAVTDHCQWGGSFGNGPSLEHVRSWEYMYSNGVFGLDGVARRYRTGYYYFYIRRPFHRKPGGGQYYTGSSAKLYVECAARLDWFEDAGHNSADNVTLHVMWPVNIGSNNIDTSPSMSSSPDPDFDSRFSVHVDESLLDSILNQAVPLLKARATEEAGYEVGGAGSVGVGAIDSVGLALDNVYLDTGVVDHVSSVPASWTWQPPAN